MQQTKFILAVVAIANKIIAITSVKMHTADFNRHEFTLVAAHESECVDGTKKKLTKSKNNSKLVK